MLRSPRPLSLLLLFPLLSCGGSMEPASVPETGVAEEGSAPFPELVGPYLGQAPALSEPVPFAPGVVSTPLAERDLAMMPDGSEVYWSVVVGQYEFTTILMSRREEGRWTEPEVAPCCTEAAYMHLEPHITPDGSHFLWLSNRPGPGPHNGGQEIWAMDRVGDGWGEPYPLPEIVNSAGSEYFPSVTVDGTLYFTRSPAGGGENRVWRSRMVDGEYQEPELLPPEVNAGLNRYNAFIHPQEEYIILTIVGMEDGYGGGDYYIVFRNDEDEWSEAVNLGPQVNTPGPFEYSPYLSPDGAFFFFMGARVDEERLAPGGRFDAQALKELTSGVENGEWNMYWMDASFLEGLRPEGF